MSRAFVYADPSNPAGTAPGAVLGGSCVGGGGFGACARTRTVAATPIRATRTAAVIGPSSLRLDHPAVAELHVGADHRGRAALGRAAGAGDRVPGLQSGSGPSVSAQVVQ